MIKYLIKKILPIIISLWRCEMIESIVDDNERILWRGKPDIVLYIVGNPAIYLVAIFWGLFD